MLDGLRGFALLGIFLMNIEWFSRPLQEMALGLPADATGADRGAAWLVQVLVQGKFWVLFALLFGMGFSVMARRAAQAGDDGSGFRRVFIRRCLMLLVLGVAHALLLWPGDILHLYALTGLLMLAMRALSPRLQAGIGVSLYVAGVVLMLAAGGLLNMLATFDADALAQMAMESRQAAMLATERYAHGGYVAATWQRTLDFGLLAQTIWLTAPMTLGVFLLGSALVSSGRIDDIAGQRPFFLRMACIALPLGVVLQAGTLALGTQFDHAQIGPAAIASAARMAASLPLALGCMAVFVLLAQRAWFAGVLHWLAPAGRMALSNYLLQSALASSLFYGYGAGLWGRCGRAEQVLLVLLVFGAQLLVSRWWLARYRFGPVEWLWRWWTYGARPALRLR